MSVDLYALCTMGLPSKSEWQAAVEEQHFPIKLDPAFDPAKDSGFWPSQLNGSPAGFEYFRLLRAEWEHLPNLGSPGRFAAGIQFSTHARPQEFVSSILVAVAIARACGGVVYDPQEGKAYDSAAMIELTKQASVFGFPIGAP